GGVGHATAAATHAAHADRGSRGRGRSGHESTERLAWGTLSILCQPGALAAPAVTGWPPTFWPSERNWPDFRPGRATELSDKPWKSCRFVLPCASTTAGISLAALTTV